MYFEVKLQEIMEALEKWEPLQECRVCRAFLPARKPTRLPCPYITVALYGAAAEPVVVGGDGRQIRTVYSVELYLPEKGRGEKALTLLDAAAECLLLSGALPCTEWTAENMRWDGDAQAFVLPCRVQLEEVI